MASALPKLAFLLTMCLAVQALSYDEGCAKCEEEFCPKAQEECLHGLGLDPCGCCPDGVCILAEREKCFNGGYGYSITDSGLRKYGACGEHMECVSRTDLRPNDRPESLCMCKHSETVCGSDNRTYVSLCEMRTENAYLRHYGPCLTGPAIVTGPQASNTYEGANLALDCEAKGFPVPFITWEFQSFSGPVAMLPGDDPTVIVHSRGGPENYMLTSWLQIEALRKNDSGTYTCVAKNSEGEDRSMVSIYVSVYSL